MFIVKSLGCHCFSCCVVDMYCRLGGTIAFVGTYDRYRYVRRVSMAMVNSFSRQASCISSVPVPGTRHSVYGVPALNFRNHQTVDTGTGGTGSQNEHGEAVTT